MQSAAGSKCARKSKGEEKRRERGREMRKRERESRATPVSFDRFCLTIARHHLLESCVHPHLENNFVAFLPFQRRHSRLFLRLFQPGSLRAQLAFKQNSVSAIALTGGLTAMLIFGALPSLSGLICGFTSAGAAPAMPQPGQPSLWVHFEFSSFTGTK